MLLLLASLLLVDACRDGADAVRRRNFAAAEPLLSKCVQSREASLESFLMLCGVYQAQGNPDALARTAMAAIEHFPSDKRFYLTAGTIAGRQKHWREAVEVLEQAWKQWPDDQKIRALLASAYFGRGTALLDAGKNNDAVGDLLRATELAPGDAEAHLNLGRALHNLLRYSDALAAFHKAGDLPLVHFHRGLALYSLGEFDKSVAEMNAQIAADEAYPPSYLVRGMARLSLGEVAAAAPDLQKAATDMPQDANAQMSCARALIQLGRYSDAEPLLRKTMTLQRDEPTPVNTLVSVLMRLERVDEARSLARHAAELARRKRSVTEGEIRFEKAGR